MTVEMTRFVDLTKIGWKLSQKGWHVGKLRKHLRKLCKHVRKLRKHVWKLRNIFENMLERRKLQKRSIRDLKSNWVQAVWQGRTEQRTEERPYHLKVCLYSHQVVIINFYVFFAFKCVNKQLLFHYQSFKTLTDKLEPKTKTNESQKLLTFSCTMYYTIEQKDKTISGQRSMFNQYSLKINE